MEVAGKLWRLDGHSIPLRDVKIDGNVQGLNARINVIQTYEVPRDFETQDATFLLPIYDVGVVTHFEAIVMPKMQFIKAKMMSRQEAEANFHEHVPAHLRLDSPDIRKWQATDYFVCRLEKLPGGSNVRIKLSLVISLHVFYFPEAVLGLVFPPCFSPRLYQHEVLAGAAVTEQKPPPSFGLSCELTLEMFAPVAAVKSPTHPCYVKKIKGVDTLFLGPEPSPAQREKFQVFDGDIYLFIQLAQPLKTYFPRSFIEISKAHNEHTVVMAALMPEFDSPPPPAVIDDEGAPHPRDILVLVDVEIGSPRAHIDLIRNGVKTFLESIRGNLQVYFNILQTAPSSAPLFFKSVLATPENINTALTFLESEKFLERCNEEPLSLLQSLQLSADIDVVSEEIPRQLLLISPLQVSSPNPLLGFVDGVLGNVSFFPVSIGPNPNYFLTETLSSLTDGAFEIVFTGDTRGPGVPAYEQEDSEMVQAAILRQTKRMLQPVVNGVRFDWGPLVGGPGVSITPMDDRLLSSDLIVTYASISPAGALPRAPFDVTLRCADKAIIVDGKQANTSAGEEVAFVCSIDPDKHRVKDLGLVHVRQISEHIIQLALEADELSGSTNQDDLRTLKEIQDEAAGLALTYGIASSDTAFFIRETSKYDPTASILLCSSHDIDDPEEEGETVDDSQPAESASISFQDVKRYSIQDLLHFKNSADSTKLPTNPHIPWDENPIWREAPVLVDSSKAKRNPRKARRGGGGSMGGRQSGAKERTTKLNVTTQWSSVDDVVDYSLLDPLLRELNANLNKITRDSFARLLPKIEGFAPRITSAFFLEKVAEVVYEEAIDAPNFSEIYAELCVNLASKYPKFTGEEPDGDGKKKSELSFRRFLLNKCQYEFQSMEHQEPIDPSLSPEDQEEQMFIRRERMKGNIVLVGELFKKRLLGASVASHVLDLLLKPEASGLPDEQNIELLCKFIPTVGPLLDSLNPESSRRLDGIFERMNALARPAEGETLTLPLRTRFLLADSVDMRKNGWISRDGQDLSSSASKTIEQVHREAEMESKKKQERIARLEREQLDAHPRRGAGGSRKDKGRGGDGRSSGGAPASPQGRKEWSGRSGRGKSLAKSGGQKRGTTEVGRSPASSPSPPAQAWREVKGGASPGGSSDRGFASPRAQRRGPGAIARGNSSSRLRGEVVAANAFGALTDEGTSSDDDDGCIIPSPTPSPVPPSDGEEDGDVALSESQALAGEAADDLPELTEKILQDKLNVYLSEYLDSEETDEVVDSVRELLSRHSIKGGIAENPWTKLLLEIVLRAADTTKKRESTLLLSLYKSLCGQSEIISKDHIIASWGGLIPILQELVIDAPLTWKNAAPFLAAALEGPLPADSLLRIVEGIVEDGAAAELVCHALAAASEDAGRSWLAASGGIEQFVPSASRSTAREYITKKWPSLSLESRL